jgi:16S rRNA (cytosine1402-N4)-methyltransferase
MVAETAAALVAAPNGRYVDGTVGEGGHARALMHLLGPDARLLGLDWDPDAVESARRALAKWGERVRVVQAHFACLGDVLSAERWNRVDGILLDLGLRSTALDDLERGFSFRLDGPLDMRFDRGRGETAADFLARIKVPELERLIAQGTTRASPRRIASAIAAGREARGLRTTGDLVRCLRASLGRRATTKLISSVFATVRMAVNRELDELDRVLVEAPQRLVGEGVLCVIAYQSQEDARVKAVGRSMFRDSATGETFRMEPRYAKPLRPSDEEVRVNPRARSARLRAFVRRPSPPI